MSLAMSEHERQEFLAGVHVGVISIERADGPVRVIATLCAGDTRESSVTARLAPTAAGPDDPAFRSLVRQMARALFPSKNDNILGNSSAFDL